MSNETREVLRICEQLPQAQRLRVAAYARSLLAGGTSQAPAADPPPAAPLEALAALQASLSLTPDATRDWLAAAAAEREGWGRDG